MSLFRLVSAFRDKLERCHRPDCALDNDWSALLDEDGRFEHIVMSLVIPVKDFPDHPRLVLISFWC